MVALEARMCFDRYLTTKELFMSRCDQWARRLSMEGDRL